MEMYLFHVPSMLCIMAFWMLISSTSCSLTQEVSPDLDKTSVVAVNPISMELEQPLLDMPSRTVCLKA